MSIQNLPPELPRFPEPAQAIKGLQFRAGEIDHMIRAYKGSSGTGFRISQIFNKILEAGVIRTLQNEKREITKMLKALGAEPSVHSLGPSLPETSEELDALILQKELQKKDIGAAIQSVKTQISNLKRAYHDAVVVHSIEEAGLGKVGPIADPKAIIESMDKLKAHLTGLKHELVRVEREIQQVEDKALTLIENPQEGMERAVANTIKRTEAKINALQAKIEKKESVLAKAPFLQRFSLKKELTALRAELTQQKNELSKLQTMQGVIGSGANEIEQEMKEYPEQMLKDIKRLGEVSVGDTQIKTDDKNPAEIAEEVKRAVRDLAKREIDEKSMDQILYVTSQNFLAPVTIFAARDPAIAMQDGWNATRQDRHTTFKMVHDNVLSITSRVDLTYTNEGNSKEVALVFCCDYNLREKDATFRYSYTVDGKTINWPATAHPFDELKRPE
ncbi:MAG: hypothetical protein JSS12_10495 [Verrucomicrobia bacterium]|nr:hypothetical protein [Verrucomicrobiota bacterium]